MGTTGTNNWRPWEAPWHHEFPTITSEGNNLVEGTLNNKFGGKGNNLEESQGREWANLGARKEGTWRQQCMPDPIPCPTQTYPQESKSEKIHWWPGSIWKIVTNICTFYPCCLFTPPSTPVAYSTHSGSTAEWPKLGKGELAISTS